MQNLTRWISFGTIEQPLVIGFLTWTQAANPVINVKLALALLLDFEELVLDSEVGCLEFIVDVIYSCKRVLILEVQSLNRISQ